MRYLLMLSMLFTIGCNKVIKSIQNQGTPEVVTAGKPLIIIMAGQSNMAGGYNEDRIVPDALRIHYVGRAGSGPIEPFAESLIQKHSALSLIIVACPVSGTYISQWQAGGYIENCIASAKTQIPTGIISGFVFLQGEADAKWGETYVGTTYEWADAFRSMVRYLKTSLNAPDMPIVLARISRTTLPGFPAWDHVRQEQDSVSMPNLAHVSTDGVTLIDGIHWDHASYVMVGERMADAMYQLLIDDKK